MSGNMTYKEFARQAAIELGYGKVIVKKIGEANNDEEIRKIMCKARKDKFGY